MIVILDYGVGNLGSIYRIFERLNLHATVSSDITDLQNADRIILPGVGAFEVGMDNLVKSGLIPVLEEKVLDEKTPILGICLGMQLFSKASDEGLSPGLGWIDANTIRFSPDNKKGELKIPHIGMNTIHIQRQNSMINNISPVAKFYFLHSFHLRCHDPKDIVASTIYGYEFPSIVQKDNITGVQFHPEKSHRHGMQLLKNFAE